MGIEEFLKDSNNKIAVEVEESQVKELKKFKSIAVKNSEFEGLFVSDCYVGFTDSYRLLAIECDSVKRIGYFRYPASSIELLNKASEIVILEDGKMAFNIKGNVTFVLPVETNVDIRKSVIEYRGKIALDINLKECFETSDNREVWKVITKAHDIDNPVILGVFKEDIEICKDFDNGSVLDISIPYRAIAGKVEKIKIGINPKFLDVWFKYMWKGISTLKINNNSSAILFQKDRLNYLVMPLAIR